MPTPAYAKSTAREWAEALTGFFVGPLLFALPFLAAGALLGYILHVLKHGF